MVEESEAGHRKKSDSNKAWAIIAVIVVIVGGFSVPLILISLEAEVTGHVVDSNGEPIPGAIVQTWRGSALTDVDGRYSLKALDTGEITLLAEADGHWSQKKLAAVGEEGSLVADFVLIEDVICYIPIGAIFLDLKPNSKLNGSLTIETNPHNSRRWVEIGDFAPGGEKPFRINFGDYGSSGFGIDVWFYHKFYNSTSYIEMTPIIVSGVYWDAPGECENCYVKSYLGVGGDQILLDVKDYLTLEEAEDEHIFRAADYGSGTIFENAPTGSFTLNEQFGAHVSVSILGEWFNCTLPVTLGSASDGQAYTQVELYSMGGNDTMVKTLVEGGHILHIWEADL